MVVAACGLRRIVIIQGTGGCPFLTGGSPSRRKGMSAGEELRPYLETEGRTKVDHRGRRGRWGDIHSLHQYAPRALQPQPFQWQSQQCWQPGGVKLSAYTPISSQLSRKMCAASAGKGRLTQRPSSSIPSMREDKGGFRHVSPLANTR
jgi:hypothetical protein